ncbi:MAG: DMT family transporter [Pseudomonadota bacterium]
MDRANQAQAAVGFMIAASAVLAVVFLLGKLLGQTIAGAEPLGPFMVSAGRFNFAFLTLMLFLAVRPTYRPTLEGAPWHIHLLRSVLGWLGVSAKFAAFAAMPLAEATAITYLNPIFAMGFAVLLLGENLTARKVIATLLAFAGAYLILNPDIDGIPIAGIYAVIAAILIGAEIAVIKLLSDREPALRILVINNGIGATLSLIVALILWQTPSPEQWMLLIGVGVLMVTAQSMFIQSLKRADASLVVPISYSILIFAAVLDLLVFKTLPELVTISGAAFILSGAVILAVKKPS